MSFVGGKRSTLGPRGSGARVQGYVRDDHSFTRGPGAIAAVDATSSARRRARQQALGAATVRDAALAALVSPPVRAALTVTKAATLLMPGQRTTSTMPGALNTKYPGTTTPIPNTGGVLRTGGAYAGARGSSSALPISSSGPLGKGGLGQPGVSITTGPSGPVLGTNTTPAGNTGIVGGATDPAAGGTSTGPIIGGGGGGGGGGGYTDPGPSGGGGGAPDPGFDPGDDGSDDGSSDGGAPASSSTTTGVMTAPVPTVPTTKSVPKWAIWAGVALGAWLITSK